jgi:cytochrome c oxidase subunit 2
VIRRALRDLLPLINEAYRTALWLPEQATSMARQLDALHYVEITAFTLMAIVFMGATVWLIVRYARRGEPRRTRRIRGPELVVVYAGGVLALFLAFWFFSFRQYVAIAAAPEDAVPIYVTAKQWMWKFEYPEGVNSAGILYVPTGRPVRMVMTSRDVIHSFYVPAFRLKHDVVPGTYTSTWFTVDRPGIYPLLCAELCGVGHSRMQARIVAMAPASFDDWLGHQRQVLASATGVPSAGTTDLVSLGERYAAQHGCLNCHTTDGRDHIGPSFAGLYNRSQPMADGGTVIADPPYLTQSMMDPMLRIVDGYPPVMPSFRGELDPAEVAALLELMKSLRDVERVPEKVVKEP